MRGHERHLIAGMLLLSLLSYPANGATVGFQPPVSYPVGTNPRAVSVGDFNGDGNLDLAVANIGDASAGNVSILVGHGNGTFQSAKNIAAGKNPSTIGVADFNGDHNLDIVVLNSDDSLSVLLGNGDGTFRAPTSYATGTLSSALRLGDVNGDQRPDLIVLQAGSLSGGAGSVGILLANGDGTFQNHIDHPIGTSISYDQNGLAVFDVNGDGKLDLVLAVGGVKTLFGNGDGTFQPGINCVCGQKVGSDNMAVYGLVGGADLNGDGRMDMVVKFVHGSLDNSLSFSYAERILLGHGDGIFDPIDVVIKAGAVPTITAGAVTAISDLNRDSHPDLAVAGSDLLVLFGKGDGSFQAVDFNVGLAQPTTSIAAADINGDSFPDVIVTSGSDNKINVLLNTTQPVLVLSINLSGNGSGTVTSDPAGVNCPDGDCSTPFETGTAVSLTAAASAGSTFTGWSGACSGTIVCNVTMNIDQNVTANFSLPDFSLSATALAPASVVAGGSAMSALSLASVNSFSSAVQFNCSVSPASALAPTCSFNPSSATPAANSSASSTLTVNTTASTAALVEPAFRDWLYAIWLPMGGLAWLGIGCVSKPPRKKMLAASLLCSLLIAGVVFQASCGGQTSPEVHQMGGTPPGTYTITVTGTSGSTQHSATVTLTVQ